MFLKVYYTIEEQTIKFKCVCTAPTCLLLANQPVHHTKHHFCTWFRGNTKLENGAQSSKFYTKNFSACSKHSKHSNKLF